MDTTFTGHHLPSRYADSRTLPSGRTLKQRLVDVPHELWMSALALLIAGSQRVLAHNRVVTNISTEDRLAIHELISLHGHLMDRGEFDRLHELFTDDVVYDLSALGGETLEGNEAIREASLRLGDGNPVGHHVTNIVVTEENGQIRARSKAIGIRRDGSAASLVYDDVLRRTEAGWRISCRRITLRRRPLQP